jgi:Secretion system C-terminal sorting domain
MDLCLRNASVLLTATLAMGFAGKVRGQGNDNCALAVPQALAIGASITLTGNNSTATGTNDFVVGSIYAGSPVFWHKFTTTACADVRVSFCGISPIWGNAFGILANTCPADQLVSANDFNTTACGDGNRTYYFNNLPAGTWSLPILNDPANNASGPFTVVVSANPCAENNDVCSDLIAQPLPVGGSLTFTGDNTNASGVNDFAVGSPYAGAPVFWHKFVTSECTDVTVRYCGQSPAWTNVFGILATDCPGNNLVSSSSLNFTECGDGNATFRYNVLPAGTYYLPVLSDAASGSAGPYSITVSAVTCVVDHNLCQGQPSTVLPLGGSITFTGDNTTATGDNDFDPGSPYAGSPVFWHKFTNPGCATVTVSYCGQSPAWTSTFAFLATDCPALNLVQFSNTNTTDCGDGNVTYIYTQLPGGDYYLPVLANVGAGSIGPYNIQVSSVACPINYDNCDQVPAQALNLGATLTFTANNANANGNGDFIAGNPYFGSPVNWHKFTTTACADVKVAYCNTAAGWNNTFGILATTCPADQLTSFTTFDVTQCANGNRTYLFDNLPAGTWYLPVLNDPSQGASGPYSIAVSAQDCTIGMDERTGSTWVVYPNPTDGSALTVVGARGTARIELMDAVGRLVHSEQARLAQGTPYQLALGKSLATGTYILRVTDERGSSAQQVQVR